MKSGNVKVPPEVYPAPKERIEAGDVVSMTPEALKTVTPGTSPKVLVDLGWPNEFMVERVFDHHVHGPCVQLQECCLRRKDLKDKKNPFACSGHPMGFFTRLRGSPEESFEPGDARASVTVPFLGELLGYNYRAKDKKATFRVGGQEMEAEGAFAELLNSIVKKHGVA